jgi:photosystem II stability/assembly factor-like uncharacterized protein
MKSLAVFFVCLFVTDASAQKVVWHQTNGPFGAGSYQYVAASTGGVALATDKHVYASTDGGKSWQPNFEGLPTGAMQLSAGYQGRIFATFRDQLFLQRSLGMTWIKLPIADTITTQLLSVVEDRHGVILANQIGAKPFRSQDSGKTWSLLNFVDSTYQVQDLSIAPDQSFYLLSYGGNVFRSSDGGNSWVKKLSITRDPARSRVIAVGNAVCAFGRNSAAFISHDQGASWKRMTLTLPDSTISDLVITHSGAWIVNAVSSKAIYRPTLGNYRSNDHGLKWDSLGVIGQGIVADSSGELYLANYNSANDGSTWNPMPLTGVRDRAPNALIEDSTHEVLFSMPNMGLFASADNGKSFTLRALRAFNCFATTADGTLYAGSRGISLSIDRGRTWRRDSTNAHLLVSTCLSLVCANTGTLYTGCNEGIAYNYHPGDTAWDGPHGLIDQKPVVAMASNRNGRPFAMLPGGMFRLEPFFGVWQPIALTVSSTFTALAVDSSQRVIAATRDGKLYFSIDEGQSWDSTVTGLPRGGYVSQIAVTADGDLYLGCAADSGAAAGILFWDLTHANFQPMDQGLVTAGHSDLPSITLLKYAAGNLYAATSDRGLFVTAGPEHVGASAIISAQLSIYPEPAQDHIWLSFTLKESSDVAFVMSDICGRTVTTIPAGHFSAGVQRLQLPLALRSGIYSLRMLTEEGATNKLIVVSR